MANSPIKVLLSVIFWQLRTVSSYVVIVPFPANRRLKFSQNYCEDEKPKDPDPPWQFYPDGIPRVGPLVLFGLLSSSDAKNHNSSIRDDCRSFPQLDRKCSSCTSVKSSGSIIATWMERGTTERKEKRE